MNVIVLIFFYFFIRENSAITVDRIQGVEGHVENVNFDSKGNIYVVASLPTNHQLYKLNPSKEVLWAVTLSDYVSAALRMYVTKQDDIYFGFTNNTYYNNIFAILKANSTIVEYVEEFENYFVFKDDNDNLFYIKDNCVHIFKPNSNASVPIQNLENFFIYGDNDATVDKSGNIYFSAKNYLAVITAESLQEEIPSATFIKLAENNKTQFEVDFVFDVRGDLWITLDTGSHDFQGTVKKLTNGTLETITVDTWHPLLKTVMIEDKIFIISSRESFLRGNDSSIYYITLDNDIVQIPELSNLTFDFLDIHGIADSEGFVYFYTDKGLSPTLGPMVVIKPDDIKPIPIELEIVDRNWIDFVKFDFNDNVWIGVLFQGLYFLKKGEYVTEKVELPADCNNYQVYDNVYVNRVLKEVYFTCYEGLYVVSN